ncbi:MAG: hypothetical protein V3576_03730 [Candidatus Cloacimonadota bacterium]
MKQLFRSLTIIVLAIASWGCLSAVPRLIPSYIHTITATYDEAPNRAIERAKTEALQRCVQENGTIDVFSGTTTEESLVDECGRDFFNRYIGVMARASVLSFSLNRPPETDFSSNDFYRVTVDLAIELDDQRSAHSSVNFMAELNTSTFWENERATISFQTLEPLYMLAGVISRDSINILELWPEPIPPRQIIHYPQGNIYLPMTLSPGLSTENGTFCVVASRRPMSFWYEQERRLDGLHVITPIISAEEFFSRIDWHDSEVKFLPFLIRKATP